ncbi:SemiSWEET family sugar transporter [Pedobacter xixiisoli]|uniref:MtN3 and saliva related transmembrane protein n=1 Tax=Pedobacter xixiisoli TaxID=1476464 RepID=A0A285ZWG2_9SPHI|nr:SemiSWEET transporter [Pedobacter xixiisoli]SOD13970.1 MtN3 and saliva related transmembrane protein [Pedobacter xixiisoli]
MDNTLLIGFAAGVLTAISTIPQIIKLIRDKKAQDVSPVMYFVLLAGNALWCYYGLLLDELPIIVTNAFSVVCDMLMIILNYRYSKK